MRMLTLHWLKLIKVGKALGKRRSKGTKGFGIEKLENHLSLNLGHGLEEKKNETLHIRQNMWNLFMWSLFAAED